MVTVIIIVQHSVNVSDERENRLTEQVLTTPNNQPLPCSRTAVSTSETTAAAITATKTSTTSCKHSVVNATPSSLSTDGKPGNTLIGNLFYDKQKVQSKYTCQPNCQKSSNDQLVWMKGRARKMSKLNSGG